MADYDATVEALATLAMNDPGLEAEVLWHRDTGWSDASGEVLEAEEIAFYAEGLLMEGFGMAWQALATADDPEPVLVRLMFWQGAAPALPDTPAGWVVAAGRHPA